MPAIIVKNKITVEMKIMKKTFCETVLICILYDVNIIFRMLNTKY